MTESPARQPSASGIEIHRGYEPGVVGWTGELHGRYYATAWGSGAAFEIQVTRDFCNFVEEYDAECDLLLTAHLNGTLIGTVSVLGQHPGPDGVQLRFFIVDPAFQGQGAGRALLETALAWCRERELRKVFLWTVDHLPQSRHLYEQVGFRITERTEDARYSVPLENLKMELTLT